jgi:hypothetical protein
MRFSASASTALWSASVSGRHSITFPSCLLSTPGNDLLKLLSRQRRSRASSGKDVDDQMQEAQSPLNKQSNRL